MPTVPVKSSNVSAIGHDPASNELTVVFANGGSYIYSGISADHHAALMAAPSLGSHLHKVIKPAAKTVRKA
jgi:hypothetical protein